MMVLGKKLRLDAYNTNSLPLYSSNDPNSCFDEDMMQQVKESLDIIRSKPWPNEEKKESKPSKGGRAIWVPKNKPKPFQYPKAKKKGFDTNSCHKLSSVFDDTGTLKSKEEKGEKGPNLGHVKKGEKGEKRAHKEGEPSAP